MAFVLRRDVAGFRIVVILSVTLAIAVLWACRQPVIEHACKWRAEHAKFSEESLRQWGQAASERTALELFNALKAQESIVQRNVLSVVLEKKAALVQQFVSCMTIASDDELLESFRIRFAGFRSKEQILEHYCQMLETSSDCERVTVLDLLRIIGWQASETLPACYRLLGDPNWMIRENAAYAIISLSLLNQLDYQRFVTLLEEDSIAEVRRAAAAALSRHARYDIEFTQNVCHALEKAYVADPSGAVRQACLASLRECRDQAVVENFVNKGLQDQDKVVRRQAASQFLPLRNALSDPRKPLLLLLADEEPEVRQAAIRAIVRQGGYSNSEISFAIDLLLASKVGPREAEVIGGIARRDPDAKRRLVSASLEGEESTKLLCTKAIGALIRNPDIDAALRHLSRSESSAIRDAATQALNRYPIDGE